MDTEDSNLVTKIEKHPDATEPFPPYAKSRDDGQVVGHITLPVRVHYIKGRSQNGLFFKFSDTIADVLDDDETRLGSIGGSIGGALLVGVEQPIPVEFHVWPSDIWEAVQKMLPTIPWLPQEKLDGEEPTT